MAGTVSQAFPFVHPAIAAAALGCGLIPVVIHLINRRRHRRVPWAAMRFLLAASRRSARRMWIEQWLLLAVRVVLIVLLGWAIARPYLPLTAFLPGTSNRVHRVIVLDNSGSMNAEDNEGRTRFDRAKEFAKGLLSSFDSQDAISFVTLANPAEAVIDHAAYDHRFVREQILTTVATHRATDVVGGISRVESIIRDSRMALGAHAVYVISDFTRNDWRGDSGTPTTPAVTAVKRIAQVGRKVSMEVHLWQVTPSRRGNVVVSQLTTESLLVGTALPVRVATNITNLGHKTLLGATWQLRRNSEIVRREPLPAIPPAQKYTALATTMFTNAGAHTLEARVILSSDDALAVDNARYLALDVRDAPSILLVDGRPSSSLISGQAGYLATALSPMQTTRGLRKEVSTSAPAGPFTTRVVSAGALANEDLDRFDAIGLCNVGRLSAARWADLEAFVRGGGGLFVSAGDLIDADNYNRYGFRDGRGLLPGQFDRLTAVNGTNEPASISLTEPSHKMVSEFEDHNGSGLFTCRVDRYLPFEPAAGSHSVALMLGAEVPLLVASSFGEGRVAVLATTVNMAWTNLPAKGDFVSLMYNVFSYLLRDRQQSRNLLVGGVIEEPVSAVESSVPIRMTTPTGRTVRMGVRSSELTLSTTFGPVDEPGFYKLSVGRDYRISAANVDPSESHTDMTAPDELARLTGCVVHSQASERHDSALKTATHATELSRLSLYVVLVLLVMEPWLAMRFAAARDGGIPRPEKQESRHGTRAR